MIKFYSIIKLSIDVRRTSSKGVPSGKVRRTCSVYVLFLVLVCSLLLAGDDFRQLRAKKIPQRTERRIISNDRPPETYKVHEVGNVWSAVSNFGQFGYPGEVSPEPPLWLPSMEWPGGSNADYLWWGPLWISALAEGEKRTSTGSFRYYSEFLPSEGTTFDLPAFPAKSVEDSYCSFDDFESTPHSTESLGIRVNQRSLTWTPEEYDDFIMLELEVIKELGGSDYSKDVLNDFYLSWLFDCDIVLGFDSTSFVDIMDDIVDFDGWDGNNPEEHVTYREDLVENGDWNSNGILDGYDDLGIPRGWQYVGSPAIPQENYDLELVYSDGFYDEYTVLLAEEWEEAPVLRWQVSSANNDYTAIAGRIAVVNGDTLRGWVFPRNTSYMYDGDSPNRPWEDTGELGGALGFIGLRLIYTDYWKEHGPYGYTPDDTLMRVFSHQWWNWESSPGDDAEGYDYQSGDHSFSRGNMFMPHPFDLGAPVFDYRFLQTTGPFEEFALGDTLRFVFAAVMGKGLQGLRENADNAAKVYFAGSEGTPYDPTGPEEDVHYKIAFPPPSPVLSYNPLDKGVLLSWDNSAEGVADPMAGTTSDFVGYRIYRSMFHPENWEFIAAFDIVDEPVILLNYETGDTLFGGAKFNLPPFDGEPLPHEFIDTMTIFTARDEYGVEVNLLEGIVRPVNNHPYFYVVTAYDDPALIGEPGLPSLESPRRNYRRDPDTGEPEPVYPKVLYDAGAQWDGKKVSIFPNPYRGGTGLEVGGYSELNFTNLPPACKISIFSLTGDLIKEIYHTAGTADASWDLRSRSGLDIVSGLYIYVVEADLPTWPEVQRGTFVVLKGN